MTISKRSDSARSFQHHDFSISIVSDEMITLPAGIVVPDAPEAERGRRLARLGGGWAAALMNTNIPVIRS